jgi:hypothetical protein
LKYLYWSRLAKPVADRDVYRWVRKQRPRHIVELGVGTAIRTRRLFEILLQDVPAAEVRYAGIDLFEARPAHAPGLPLKQMHTLLKPIGIKVQLIPGDPFTALSRAANGLTKTDLLIISADQDAESLARAWIYVPRMLLPESRVLLETGTNGQTTFLPLTLSEVEQRASQQLKATRRAA